jgi:hypothetical protein
MGKVELALVELARLNKQIKYINSLISEQILLSMENEPPNASALSGHKCDGKSYWLYMAYWLSMDGDGPYSQRDYYYENHEGDVEGYLAEHCQHALKAHLLIQERKVIRKQLGIAKRRVTFFANRLLAETGQ